MKLRLKERRELCGLSQKDLAIAVGTSLKNLQKIEYGGTKGIKFSLLEKLCKTLNCTAIDLFSGEACSSEAHEGTLSLQEMCGIQRTLSRWILEYEDEFFSPRDFEFSRDCGERMAAFLIRQHLLDLVENPEDFIDGRLAGLAYFSVVE